ncbi:MAG TPA: tRNA (guanine-N7)-methyltransferase [Myxococcaceae bacterium]|nr:tRNA (guanine-N7)-methyltransferase [Myxococcaceae bacterium]
MARPPLRPEPVGLEFVGRESPPDWDEVFGFHGPLELEIGSGAGGFALEYCRRFPHVRYLAFEWRRKYARDLQYRAEKMGLKNVRAVEADARFEVPRLFKPASLAAVHFQFPDPWWKRSHAKRAVLQPDFARLLLELTVPGGLFDLRTDVRDRGVSMLETLESVGWVNPLGPGVFHPHDPEEVPSTRERRYLISGEPVYRARLRKPT